MCLCVDYDYGDDDVNLHEDPDWLEDLETAAAVAELHDAVQASAAERQNTGKDVSIARSPETNLSVFYRSVVDGHQLLDNEWPIRVSDRHDRTGDAANFWSTVGQSSDLIFFAIINDYSLVISGTQ